MCVCVSLSQASFFQLRDQRTMHSCKLGHVLFATQGKESVTATRARAERKKKREREREREGEGRVRDNGQDCELRQPLRHLQQQQWRWRKLLLLAKRQNYGEKKITFHCQAE